MRWHSFRLASSPSMSSLSPPTPIGLVSISFFFIRPLDRNNYSILLQPILDSFLPSCSWEPGCRISFCLIFCSFFFQILAGDGRSVLVAPQTGPASSDGHPGTPHVAEQTHLGLGLAQIYAQNQNARLQRRVPALISSSNRIRNVRFFCVCLLVKASRHPFGEGGGSGPPGLLIGRGIWFSFSFLSRVQTRAFSACRCRWRCSGRASRCRGRSCRRCTGCASRRSTRSASSASRACARASLSCATCANRPALRARSTSPTSSPTTWPTWSSSTSANCPRPCSPTNSPRLSSPSFSVRLPKIQWILLSFTWFLKKKFFLWASRGLPET